MNWRLTAISLAAAGAAVWAWRGAVGEWSFLVGGAVLLLPAVAARSRRP